MRVSFVYVSIFLGLMLANNASLAAGTLHSDTSASGVRIFNSAEEALQFNATSKEKFYLEAGSYNSVNSSLKRQFHLSREIQYPVIIEVKGKRHLVLVGPLHSAKAVKSLRRPVFGSAQLKKQAAGLISKVEYTAVYPGEIKHKKTAITPVKMASRSAVHHKPRVAPIVHVRHPAPRDPGVKFIKNNHNSKYQRAALTPDLKIIKSEAKALNFQEPSSNGPFYLQAGAFNAVQNARNQQRQLSRQVHYPVRVEKEGNFHIVLIGPVHSAADIRALGSDIFASTSVREQAVAPAFTPAPVAEDVYVPPRYQAPVGDKDAALVPELCLDHADILAAGGIASLSAGNSSQVVTATETDQLIQTNANDLSNPVAQLGVGYVHAFPGTQQYSEHIQWLPFIEPEINAYYLGSKSIQGDVLPSAGSNVSNLTYSMPFSSTRLMFDAALTIATMKQVSVYGKAGIGNAWNTIGYNDQRLNLNSQTTSHFAWEAGGGLLYNFNNRIGISLEYLYTDLGWLSTSAEGNTGTILAPTISPGEFNLNSQTGLIGLHIAI